MSQTRPPPRSAFDLPTAFALLLFGGVEPARAQPDRRASAPAVPVTSSRAVAALVDSVFERHLRAGRFRGAAFVFVHDSGTAYARGYGFADAARRLPVDPDRTPFRAASVSKLFAATAVMQLAEQGRVRLDVDVNRYLGRVRVEAPPSRPVTAADLLTHTAGVQSSFLGGLALRPEDIPPLSVYFARRPPRVVGTPGARFSYSSAGLALAGYLVETASGEPFYAYAERHILAPLGMRHSSFRQPAPAALRIDEPRSPSGQPPFIVPYPAGALVTTASDMARFVAAHLNQGQGGAGRILSPATTAEMHRRHWAAHPGAQGVAYGFFESVRNGRRALFHTGDSGDHSLLWMLPDERVGLYVAYRGAADGATLPLMEELTQRILDHFFADAAPASVPLALPPPMPAAELRRFTGVYRSNGVNEHTVEKVAGLAQQIEFRDAGGTLVAAPLGGAPVRLVPVGPRLFRTDDGGVLAFAVGPSGHADGATLSGSIWDPNGMHRVAPYEDARLHLGAGAVVVVLFISRLLTTVAAVVRRRRRPRRPAPAEPVGARVAWRASGLVAGTLALVPVAALATALTLRPPVVRVPFGVFAALALLTVAVALALTLPWFAALAWRRRHWSTGRRIYFTALAAGGLVLAALLGYWNLLGFRL